MASPSVSASEGEIIEMEYDKATLAQPVTKDIRVDRPSRKPSSSSTSPSRSSAGFDAPHYRSRSRSRSRSPYRYRSPRGEKRRRNDGYSDERGDKRRFKVHYEQPRQRRSNHDLDRNGRHEERYHDRPRDRERRRRSRSRSRSRSPFSHRKSNSRNHERFGASSHAPSPSRQEKTSEKPDKLSETSKIRGSHAESSQNIPLARERSNVTGHASDSRLDAKPRGVAGTNPEARGDRGTEDSTELEMTPVDEAAQIEARRKRREALKAKLKSQPTPLLAQALQASVISSAPTPNSESNTPIVSRSASPMVGSPKSQTAVDSPAVFAVENDEELANRPISEQLEEGDDPSAADYDPTADMQEDRARHDHRLHHDQDVAPLPSVEEPMVSIEDVPMPDATSSKARPAKDNADEYDMFADDNDDEADDMFAPGPTIKATTAKSAKPKELAANLLDNWDDPEGYYRIILGELLDGRYHVQANLGKGMFSAVVRADDNLTGKLVAIKIIRNNETMKKAGLKEIDILQKLSAADPEGKKHVIRLERSFEHKGHLCMVFENLSINLREVLKKFGRDVGINLKAVRSYAQQMFLGLSLLKKCNILHADIKPDNMLVNETRNVLKLCDLGSAGDASENDITPYLVSRFYRAPEIILGMPYDFGIDTWSVGCTLFELYTGKILFTGRNNNQMLRSIMECRGKFSLKMLKKAEFAGMHFDEKLMFMSAEKDKVTGKDIIRLLSLLKPTRDLKTRLMSAAKGLGEADMKELNLFADLLDRCLALNPEKRITPSEALKHPFITRSKA